MKRAVACAAVVIAIACPRGARAEDFQLSSRLYLGGGAEQPQGPSVAHDTSALFELGLRAEALWGASGADDVRIGPALDLRTANFRTFEAAGGAQLLLPIGWDFAVLLTVGGGYALRDRGRDGPILLGTLAASYRPYDHFDCYGHAVSLYVSGRAGLDPWSTWEITGGVEIDLEFLFVIPVAFLITATRGHDPDEPEEP